MMAAMVKEADLNRIDVPEGYEVLDATALGRRLGFRRETVLAYLSQILAIFPKRSCLVRTKPRPHGPPGPA